MKSFLKIFWPLAASAAVTACSSAAKEEKKAEKAPDIQEVAVAEVQEMRPSKQILLPGELKPWNRVSLYAKVKGFVRHVQADRGTWVRKGQILAQLDAPEILSELSQAQAQMQAQEAALAEQTARFRAGRLTYQRLLQTNRVEGAVSAHELDQAQAKMQADSALVAIAAGNVQAGRSFYQTKTELRQYLTIVAPFDGIITERNISAGALVGAGDSNAKPLFVLEDSRTLRLTVAVPETFANQLPAKSAVTFTVNAIPEHRFNARFARSAESLAEANRAMLAEFDVDNSARQLKSGMYAEVRLPVERTGTTLFVPKTSVVSSSEKTFVIRVKGNKAEWVAVEKGNVLDSLVEVFGNLQPKESIVRAASEEIRDGQPLKISQK
ncbi:MAG: efflux RND transporter periplasmic adaptor subunit [Spirosomataceae bacterium]